MNGSTAPTDVLTDVFEDRLGGFGEAMQNIYAGNYGDDIADIGSAMATVAQNAKNLNPTNIERMTTT